MSSAHGSNKTEGNKPNVCVTDVEGHISYKLKKLVQEQVVMQLMQTLLLLNKLEDSCQVFHHHETGTYFSKGKKITVFLLKFAEYCDKQYYNESQLPYQREYIKSKI